jgi:hypothetical protein
VTTQDRIETRIQFRAGDRLFAFLAPRSLRMGTRSADLQARTEIEIWRDVMRAELRTIPLTVAEASCLAAVLKGHSPSRHPSPSALGICYAECEQVFRLAQDLPAGSQPWPGVSQDTLLAKLRRLGPAADLALEDAIADWHAPHRKGTATADGFTEVGLRIIPGPSAGPGQTTPEPGA